MNNNNPNLIKIKGFGSLVYKVRMPSLLYKNPVDNKETIVRRFVYDK